MSDANHANLRIVVGVDGSQPSIAALRWAVREAELTGGTIEALMAWEYPLVAGGWAPIAAFDETDYVNLAARALNDAVAEVTSPSDVKVCQTVIVGNPAQALIEAAKAADLLVVGNRGHGSFVDVLIGSVSARCVHHATCPVVVVRSPRDGS